MIEKKVTALKKRIFHVAALSAAEGAGPIPGLGAVIDFQLIISEVEEYKRQLGLDDKTLEALSRDYHIPKDTLVNTVDMSNITKVITAMIAEQAADISVDLIQFIPVLGQIAGASMSFETASAVLRRVLSKLRVTAIKIFQLTLEASKDLYFGSSPSPNREEWVRKTVEASKDLGFASSPLPASPDTGERAANGDPWLWMAAVLGTAVVLTLINACTNSPLLLNAALALPALIAIAWFYEKA